MTVIPFQISETEYSVYIGMSAISLDRMREYDPAEVPINRLGERFERLKLKDVIIGYCTEEDVKAIEGKPLSAVLRHLSRGFKFRPEAGDHDRGPESIFVHPSEPIEGESQLT